MAQLRANDVGRGIARGRGQGRGRGRSTGPPRSRIPNPLEDIESYVNHLRISKVTSTTVGGLLRDGTQMRPCFMGSYIFL